ILGIGKGVLRVFSLDFPLLGAPPIPIICSIILTLDFPLLEAEVALICCLWILYDTSNFCLLVKPEAIDMLQPLDLDHHDSLADYPHLHLKSQTCHYCCLTDQTRTSLAWQRSWSPVALPMILEA
ncbi:hypothetical protein L208DRAFT_1236167, partial [Tricholoma matsutake]